LLLLPAIYIYIIQKKCVSDLIFMKSFWCAPYFSEATSRKWSHFSFASLAVGWPQGFGSVTAPRVCKGLHEGCWWSWWEIFPKNGFLYPKQPMYGIFTYIYHKNQPTVGKYPLHGWYGYWWILGCCCVVVSKMFILTPILIFTFELSFSDGVYIYI